MGTASRAKKGIAALTSMSKSSVKNPATNSDEIHSGSLLPGMATFQALGWVRLRGEVLASGRGIAALLICPSIRS